MLLVIGINTCKKARKFLNIPKGHKIFETFTAGYSQFSYKRYTIKEDLNVLEPTSIYFSTNTRCKI